LRIAGGEERLGDLTGFECSDWEIVLSCREHGFFRGWEYPLSKIIEPQGLLTTMPIPDFTEQQ
jgi:hypothetical protein